MRSDVVPTETPAPEAVDWLAQAERHRKYGSPAEAYRPYFRVASSGAANAPAGWLGMAEMALRLSRDSEASKHARRALDLGVAQPPAWRVIAAAACRLGDAAAAREAYSNAGGGECEAR